jgi:hypothetical protein
VFFQLVGLSLVRGHQFSFARNLVNACIRSK